MDDFEIVRKHIVAPPWMVTDEADVVSIPRMPCKETSESEYEDTVTPTLKEIPYSRMALVSFGMSTLVLSAICAFFFRDRMEKVSPDTPLKEECRVNSVVMNTGIALGVPVVTDNVAVALMDWMFGNGSLKSSKVVNGTNTIIRSRHDRRSRRNCSGFKQKVANVGMCLQNWLQRTLHAAKNAMHRTWVVFIDKVHQWPLITT